MAVGIILLLKSHLKSLYGLTEEWVTYSLRNLHLFDHDSSSKCSKWVPGKKSALGDKPATKRREVPLVWDRIPHATLPIRTEEEAIVQQAKVKSFHNLARTRKMSDPQFLPVYGTLDRRSCNGRTRR